MKLVEFLGTRGGNIWTKNLMSLKQTIRTKISETYIRGIN